ncbi:tyrosine-type recombinase/integrase [Gelidibacter salicanalis]|uniref:Tyrosine-type recombinase/integrase n=1 Tax=Gelidibacter salicanalis TaxID=291193 RepID=A0A934KXD7_9FLAO|nr:tyrosine-type recombinase/integrase [Gelidibacter salicanalis]
MAHLALHFKESPETLSVENIQSYLYYCQKLHKTPSESFFKHTIFGLRAAYIVMGMEAKRVALPQIKRDLKLPIVLSQEEVKRLLKAPKYLKHRLIIGMLYGCGLRSYELCNLKLADIDFDRRTVFVPKKKGKIDRYVPLSKYLVRGLKKYIRTENPQGYLFNSQVTKDGVARGLTTNGIRWVIKENRSKIGSSKKITAHTLRHTFATHLLEYGVDIVSLKELLGHAHIEMTLTYLHVANLPSGSKFSPLDKLYD